MNEVVSPLHVGVLFAASMSSTRTLRNDWTYNFNIKQFNFLTIRPCLIQCKFLALRQSYYFTLKTLV